MNAEVLQRSENWLPIWAGISFTKESFKWSCLYLWVCCCWSCY